MRTKIRARLDRYTVHCPTCGADVKHGSPAGRNEDSTTTRRPAQDPTIPSWVIDLEVDRMLEESV